eukprot:m.121426 g.121426  ORF g.121426 m.121426 type:complete len:185 (+) comp14396_c0_seq4:101-655(+)
MSHGEEGYRPPRQKSPRPPATPPPGAIEAAKSVRPQLADSVRRASVASRRPMSPRNANEAGNTLVRGRFAPLPPIGSRLNPANSNQRDQLCNSSCNGAQSEDNSEKLAIAIRLPSGKRIQHEFPATCPVSTLGEFVIRHLEPEERHHGGMLVTTTSRVEYSDTNISLQEAGLKNKTLLAWEFKS